MNDNRKRSYYIIKSISALTVITLSLTACAQNPPNVTPDPNYISSDYAMERDGDYYAIAYGNMVNLEAAVKHKNPDVLFALSNIQIMYGAYEQALETVNRGLAFSDNMMLVANKVDLLERLGQYDAREALIEQVLSETKDRYTKMSLEERLKYTYLHLINGENDKAIGNYLELLESGISDTHLAELYNNMGLAHLNLYDYENAKINFEKSLQYEPGSSVTLSNLGNCYFALEDYEKALELYDEAILIDQNNSYGIFGYASAAQVLENYDMAIDMWKQYVVMIPQDIDGWVRLYECYLMVEDVDGQDRCLEALISLAPAERSYAYDQLIVKQELGQLVDPVEITKAYREAVGDYQADWLIADFTYYNVSIDEGLAQYEALLSYDGLTYTDFSAMAQDVYYFDEATLLKRVLDKTEATLSREERLEIEAYIYYYDEDPEKLMQAALELVSVNPESGYGYEYLGDAFYFAKDYKNAAANYGLAAIYNEDSYYSSLAQVDSLILLGEIEEANQLSAQFLESFPDYAFGYVYQARIDMKLGLEEAAVDHLVTAMTLSDYLGEIFETYVELAPLKERPELDLIGE